MEAKTDYIVHPGTAIATGRKDLEGCLSELRLSSSVLHQRDTKTEMHKALQLVEKKSCPLCNDISIESTEVRQLFEVSHVLNIFIA